TPIGVSKEKPMRGKRPSKAKAVTLKIPGELYRNLARVIEGTGFRSVTEFAIYVLRDVAAGGRLDTSEGTPGLTAREIEAIRQRLRALGYIE
ncbi:MAG: hypothetical protein ACPMAQ_03930, partial [Phycisphaerae bacterium]